jgi:hypothetical protein
MKRTDTFKKRQYEQNFVDGLKVAQGNRMKSFVNQRMKYLF